MLVMSALGVSADPEWVAVRQALAGRAVMPLQLDVWVGERELARKVEQDLQELQMSGEVHMLKDGFDLLASIKRFDPHVLHLFCHGTGGDSPLLRLATRRDHLTGSGSSILIEPLQLRDHIGSTWLVTLNCCDSGSDADGARSIANLLVTLGYPAILGMREPVSTKNSSLIAHSLYKSLLDYVEVNVVPGRETTLEIADVLVGTRRKLRDQFTEGTPAENAARHRDWTLPVLYVRPDPLRVKCVTAAPQHDASTRRSSTNYLDTLMKYRLQAPPDTPANVLKRLDDEIARALRALEGDDVGGDAGFGG
jgi:hypothetical protein